jgi:cysteine-rich repeat protein
VQHGTMSRFVFATLLVAVGMPPPATAVDLSGDYLGFATVPFTVTDVQTGTALQMIGHVVVGSTTFPLSATGTVDPATGAFSVSGEITGLCPEFVYSGTGDGEELTGTFTSPTCPSGRLFLTKCGNGAIDPLENCEDGNHADGDCCSARCRLEGPAGTACTSDYNDCTNDVCTAAGTCTHVPVPCPRTVVSRDVARCMATQCDGIGRKTCRRRCKPPAIRTLAYVVSECRVDAAGLVVARQALRIRRGNREPITVVEFGPSGPVPDPLRLCFSYGESLWGSSSVVVFPLQRLGVSPDGSGVVFEVNDEFSVAAPSWLSPEQKGMFFVRSDGHGLRRLGPASRDPSFRIGQTFNQRRLWDFWVLSPPILFSPNGRRVAFTDLGPGPGGVEAVQIFVLDLATGERRQVTHLPSGTPPQAAPEAPPYFLTCCPKFVDNETILFQTFVDPDGSNPEHNFAAFTVGIGGGRLKSDPTPVALPDSHLVPSFAVTGVGTKLARLSVPGTPVNHAYDPRYHFPIAEVFLQDGENLVQLTNFRRFETFLGFLNPTRTRAFFLASADPLGTNPDTDPLDDVRDGYCQIFSMDTEGRRLRQVTHLNSRVCRPLRGPGCAQAQGIGYGHYRLVFQDPVTEAVIFDSTCDPLGANPNSYKLFAIRPDGDGLRQLTDASGMTTEPDGSFRVQLPGPFAYSARNN